MDLDLVFLGTSASVPTPARAPAALLIRRGGERLLFDCAEGTQRQLMRSVLGLRELDRSLDRLIGRLSYPVELEELRAGEALERDGYRILGVPVHHGVSALG